MVIATFSSKNNQSASILAQVVCLISGQEETIAVSCMQAGLHQSISSGTEPEFSLASRTHLNKVTFTAKRIVFVM